MRPVKVVNAVTADISTVWIRASASTSSASLSVASSRRPPSTLSYPVTSATHFHKNLGYTFSSVSVTNQFPLKSQLCRTERAPSGATPHRESAEWSDATPREPRQPRRGASRRSRLGRHVRVARGGGVHARALSLARSGESVCESELHIGSSDDRHGAPTVRELTVELGATVDELVGGVVSGECTPALARSPLVQPERYAPRRVQEGQEDQGRGEHHRRRQPEQLQVPTAPDGAVQAGMERGAR